MRRILVLLTIVGAALWAGSPAHADPPGAVTEVSCEQLLIDPPPTYGVTFEGTIGGQQISLPAERVAGTHDSTADISAYTTAAGPIGYSITPVWSLPPNPYGLTSGEGTPVEGTLECHEAPTTTVTESTTTPTTAGSTSTTVCAEPRGCCLADCNGGRNGQPPELPRTGHSDTMPLLGIGGSLLLAGLALLSRRWKIQDRTD